MVLAAEREAVAVTFEVGEIDEVGRFRDAAREVRGVAPNVARPTDGKVGVGQGIELSARIAVTKDRARREAVVDVTHRVVRENAPRVVKRDVFGRNARMFDEAFQKRAHENGVPVALFREPRRIGAVGARTVHVHFDRDFLAATVAACGPFG